MSFLCSTELPSAAVSFLELPEKTPESAAKRLRFKPAYTFASSDQWSATFQSEGNNNGSHTLALALVVSSLLSTIPERAGAASCFFETVEDDMIEGVKGMGLYCSYGRDCAKI